MIKTSSAMDLLRDSDGTQENCLNWLWLSGVLTYKTPPLSTTIWHLSLPMQQAHDYVELSGKTRIRNNQRNI